MTRSKKRNVLALAACGVVALVFVLWRASKTRDVAEEARRGDYRITVERAPTLPPIAWRLINALPDRLAARISEPYIEASASIVVRRGRTEIFTHSDFSISLATSDESAAIPEDLTGDGIPDIAILSFSGGAHCCTTLYVYSCGPEFKLIDTIELEHGSVRIEDLDGDSVPEFQIRDWTFQYWPGSFASSPAPAVILRFREGAWRVAADLMKRPAPSGEEIALALREQKEIIAADERESTAGSFAYALDLIYSGHEPLAMRFLKEALAEYADGTEIIAEFREILESSPYWQELQF